MSGVVPFVVRRLIYAIPVLLVVTAGNEDAMHEAMQRTMIRVVKNIRVFSSEEIFWSQVA